MCSTRKAAYIILAALFYLFLRGIGDHGLLDPMEGVHASVALNMVARGNAFFPMIGDLPYIGKSMGFWWLSSLGLILFGWLEFSVRFWPALAGLGVAVVSWFITRRTMNERAANYAAVIAGTNLLTYGASQIASPHTLFALCVTGALAGIVYAFRDRRFFLLLHAASAAALIICGPIGIILPWLCLLIYAYIAEQEDFLLSALSYWPGLLATTLLAGGYLLALYIKNPEILTLMRYNPPEVALNSFSSSLMFLAAGFFPWVGVLPYAFKSAWPGNWRVILPSEKEGVLLLVWWGVFTFFGLFSGDALLLMAATPALTVLCANFLAKAVEEGKTARLRHVAAMEILLFVLFLFIGLPWFYLGPGFALRGTLLSVVPWTLFCLFFLCSGWYYSKTRQPRKLMLHLCAYSMLSLLPLAGVFDLLAAGSSMQNVGVYLKDRLQEDSLLVQYAMNRPSLFFYTAKDSLLIDADASLRIRGQNAVSELELNQAWNETRRVFLVIARSQKIGSPLPREVYNLYETMELIVLSNARESLESRIEVGRETLAEPEGVGRR